MQPKETEWGPRVKQIPEREASELSDSRGPIFHPKRPLMLGQRPYGVWPAGASTTGPRRIVPVSNCPREAVGMKTPLDLGCSDTHLSGEALKHCSS